MEIMDWEEDDVRSELRACIRDVLLAIESACDEADSIGDITAGQTLSDAHAAILLLTGDSDA